MSEEEKSLFMQSRLSDETQDITHACVHVCVSDEHMHTVTVSLEREYVALNVYINTVRIPAKSSVTS